MKSLDGLPFYRAIFDAIPSPLFLVDDDVKIVVFNKAASTPLGEKPALALSTRGGEALHCIHSTVTIGGCGASEACKICVVRPLAVLMFQDIGELVSTQGLVPICMHCHQVRDTSDRWAPMENYLKDHLNLDPSHGQCPACLQKYYPDFSSPASG